MDRRRTLFSITRMIRLLLIAAAGLGSSCFAGCGLGYLEEATEGEWADEVTLVVVNAVESTVQVSFATGSGSLADGGGTEVSSEVEARVAPGSTTVGTGVCAQEYIVAAAHLEAIGTTVTEDSGDGPFSGGGNTRFHSVVLTGDGTGTEGFDSNSIAILRGRLLQRGTHFDCGDTITVTITATNNQIQLDQEGAPVVDAYGNPIYKYNVGTGEVKVTSAQ